MKTTWAELNFPEELSSWNKLTNPYIFATNGVNILYFDLRPFELLKVYKIGLQRYRVKKICI